MRSLSLIHLEHALPPLAELGLEHLVPALMGGGQALMDEATVKRLLDGVAAGASRRAARRLVMVTRATAQELLALEADPSVEAAMLEAAATLPAEEAFALVKDFFSSLGLSPKLSLTSSESGKGEGGSEPQGTSGSSAES